MKKLFTLFFLICGILSLNAQDLVRNKLIAQGAWFLFSTRTEEQFDNDQVLAQIDFCKKSDTSSIFFDEDDKLYSVFSKESDEVLEDLWRIVDNTHFVIVSPIDGVPQLMDIIDLDSKRLVVQNCTDIDSGTRCMTYTYFCSKDGWLSDKEIDELNSAGVIELDKLEKLVDNQ